MNNLHRELAPISGQAWGMIDQEASRTLRRHLAARRVVDVLGPKGVELSGIGTGRVLPIDPLVDGVGAVQREVKALVELRVRFELSRKELDTVERGGEDPDLQPLKTAARNLALAEDRAVFEGYRAAGITGIRQASSNDPIEWSTEVQKCPALVAQAVSRLREVGVNGPYRLLLGETAYTAASGATDGGYSVLKDLERLVDGEAIWAPALAGAAVLASRGGDFEFHLGQDISIGYLSHSESSVCLYLQESFTFRSLTAEAAVLMPPGKV